MVPIVQFVGSFGDKDVSIALTALETTLGTMLRMGFAEFWASLRMVEPKVGAKGSTGKVFGSDKWPGEIIDLWNCALLLICFGTVKGKTTY